MFAKVGIIKGRGIAPNTSIFGNNYLNNQSNTEAQAHDPLPGGVTADIYNMSYGIGYPVDNNGNTLSPTAFSNLFIV